MRPPPQAILRALGIGGITGALLCLNLALSTADMDLSRLDSPRRYWEDTSVAIKLYLDGAFPAPVNVTAETLDESSELSRFLIVRRVQAEEIRPWQFWRTLGVKPFLAARDKLAPGRFFEDQGRARLLAFGYRMLGGIAPFLLAWLGLLVCLPVLLWTLWELCDAGLPLAAATYGLLLASSPFLVDCLSLPHSGTGFYMIVVVLVSGLAVYGVYGQVSRSGLALRALAAGAVFALCTICRSGAQALLPGLVLAVGLGFWRAWQPSKAPPDGAARWRTLRTWLPLPVLLLCLVLPYLLARPAERHFVWSDIWKGIGDFDRTKHHPNRDGGATDAVRAAGIPFGPDPRFPFVSPETEAYFRQSVLGDIRSDPGWYAGILAHRVFATLTQQRLWPWKPIDGLSVARLTHPNEGNVDKYYSMTTSVDFLGYGAWRVELPVSLLSAPLCGLALVWLAATGSGRWPDARARCWRALLALWCPTVATLPLPVLISTAGAMETQAFAFTWFLAWALALQELADAALRRRAIVATAGPAPA